MSSNPKYDRSGQQELPIVDHANRLTSSSNKYKGCCQTKFKFTFAISIKRDRFTECETALKSENRGRIPSGSSKRTVYQDSCYFHIEYLSEPGQTFSTDVIFFTSLLAKVYPFGRSSHTVKPVEYRNKLWVVWSEHIPGDCTDKLIQEYAKLSRTTGLQVKCWNAREKCSISARFDKPRSVITEPDLNEQGDQELSPIVQAIERLYTESSRHCHEEYIEYSDDHTINFQKSELSGHCGNVDTQRSKTLRHASSRSGATSRKTSKRDKNLCATQRSAETFRSRIKNAEPSPQRLAVEAYGDFCVILNPGFHFLHQPPKEIVARKPTRPTELPIQPLSCSTWLQPEVACDDFLVGWELSPPLLSPEQRQHFRPLVIRASCLNRLPKGEFSDYEEMQRECCPLHFTWKLGDQETHVSRRYKQREKIHFTEMQVLLTGAFSATRLKELLLSEPLVINIFDRLPRSRAPVKSSNTCKDAMAIFGTLDTDYNIGRVQASMPTVPSKLSPAVADHQFTVDRVPSGQVLLPLDNFVTMKERRSAGHRPVLPISDTDIDLNLVLRGTSENPRRASRKYIGYLDAGCDFRITVDLGFEINSEVVGEGNKNAEILYDRFVTIFNGITDTSLPRPSCIAEIEQCLFRTGTKVPTNSSEPFPMECDGLADETKLRLPCRLLSSKRGHSSEVNDELTGMHISDSHGHVLIVEWCVNDRGVALKQRLLQMVERVSRLDPGAAQVRFIYNSEVKFTERLYRKPLRPGSEVWLTRSLDELSRQPMLYVRDRIPRLAYCAINRLRYIRQYCHTITDILHAGQFPTAEMVQALERLYSVPRILSSSLSLLKSYYSQQRSPELSSKNTTTHASQEKSNCFESSRMESGANKACKTKAKRFQHYQITPYGETQVFNYSIQAQNSTLAARREMWDNVLDHGERYTYSQKYLHSASFEPYANELQWQLTLRALTQRPRSFDGRKHAKKQNWDNFRFQKGYGDKTVSYKALFYQMERVEHPLEPWTQNRLDNILLRDL